MQIRKRDGRIEEFNNLKIKEAIKKAYISTGQKYDNEILNKIASQVEDKCYKKINVDLKDNTDQPIFTFDTSKIPTVEEIQNLVEVILMDINPIVAKSYIRYRYKREVAREYTNEFFDEIGKKLSGKYVQNQNANVDEASFGGRIGEATSHMMKTYALNFLMSPMSKKNHEENMIYIHDLDHYPVGDHNCMSIPFDKLLANGFNTRQTDVRPANSVSTAFQLVAVIFQLQSLQQFGGTSATHLDWTMVPYVRKSFFKHFKNALDYLYNSNSEWLIAAIENDKIENISIDDKLYDYNKDAQNYALQMTLKEINQSVEGLYHNLNY